MMKETAVYIRADATPEQRAGALRELIGVAVQNGMVSVADFNIVSNTTHYNMLGGYDKECHLYRLVFKSSGKKRKNARPYVWAAKVPDHVEG